MGVDAEILVLTRATITALEVEAIRYRMCEAFGAERFWQWMGATPAEQRRALEIVTEYDQDGPTLHPEPGETFIRCYPATRYYGPGYERGDLVFLIYLAEYLERAVPGASVWYGSDSSGVLAAPFGPAEREAMFTYFLEVGHEPYAAVFAEPGRARPLCDFCKPMRQCGFGAGYAGFYCPGCDKNLATRDDGQTYQEEKDVALTSESVKGVFRLETMSTEDRHTLVGLLQSLVENPQNRTIHLILNDWLRERYPIPTREVRDIQVVRVKPAE